MAAPLVQKFIVEDAEKASSLLPQHVALVSPDGTPWTGEGTAPGNATTSEAGLVKKASGVTTVASADATDAASETVTKAEFDAVVAVANETKKQLNDLISNMKTAGQMA